MKRAQVAVEVGSTMTQRATSEGLLSQHYMVCTQEGECSERIEGGSEEGVVE